MIRFNCDGKIIVKFLLRFFNENTAQMDCNQISYEVDEYTVDKQSNFLSRMMH